MNTKERYALIFALALLGGAVLVAVTWAAPGNAPLAPGGAPTVVSYQGEVRVGGAPYTGNGYFKFAVVNAAGNIAYWSNDGTSMGGGEPTTAVQLAVSDGLFSVLLGDTTLGGMTQALTADVFSQPDRYLRVWFGTGVGGPSQLTPDTRIAAVPYALQAQEAADADTVDGLHASELGADYQNVVVVAKSGGDYTSVQAAIDSISDAAADNPYLVWVAPGVYSEMVTMKPYVHLQGAGQEATVITSAASSGWLPTEATLILASDASLRDLTVSNSGAGDRNVALLATAGVTRTLAAGVTARAQGSGTYNYTIFLTGSGTGVTLQQVTALGENGASANYGLYNFSGAAATLRGGSFTARGGTIAYGIYNGVSGATLEAENVSALGENGSSDNRGLSNYLGAATLRGGSYTGRGGTEARGISTSGSGATLEAESVTALGNGNSSYGLRNYDGAAATLRGGSFTGRGGMNVGGIYNSGSGAMLETESVTALGENGNSNNYGLSNSGNGVTATLRGGSFTGRARPGGTNANGIYNGGNSTALEAESVTALGENGSNNNYGLRSSVNATANVTQSVLEGATNSVYRGSGSVTVSNSRLVDGVVSGAVTCVAVSWNTTFYPGSCP
jgi:hypothetical protein